MMPDFPMLVRVLAPEAALILGAIFVIGADLGFLRRASDHARNQFASAAGGLTIVAALAVTGWAGAPGPVFGDVLMLDYLAVASRVALLLLSLITLAFVSGGRANRNPAEYVALILLGSVGLILLPAAHQLLLSFAALELTSLSLYVLAAMDKSRPAAAEAALKYFLVGGISAAFLLFGFSLIYGMTGSLGFAEIAPALFAARISPLVAVALVMIVVALGFKLAAAPFHFWAPDVYQGSPAASVALISSGSKLAALVFFYRLFWPGLHPLAGAMDDFEALRAGWRPIVLGVAVAALLLGNLAALAQSSVRRLMAYSAIAHAGVMLIALMVAGPLGVGSLLYYGFTYGIATAGVFGVLAVLEREGAYDIFDDFAGLSRRSPLLAWSLAVFVLSLAGIPPLAGFFAKFHVLAQALRLSGLHGPLGWVAMLAILLSAVSLYYYLLILKKVFVATPAKMKAQTRVRVPAGATAALLFAIAMTFVLGIAPSVMLDLF